MAIASASEKKRVRMLPAMPEMREHATAAAAFLKALANDQRLMVLCALLDGELSVGEINEHVPLSQSALSQHLSVLREAGMVTTARQSQTIYYSVARGPALQIMEVLYSAFCAPSGSGAAARKSKCGPSRKSQVA
jgi:ArsR family transcriptional regulator, virulence genes transcriptional regulator